MSRVAQYIIHRLNSGLMKSTETHSKRASKVKKRESGCGVIKNLVGQGGVSSFE